MTNIQIALSALPPNQTLKISPKGTSMCPLLLGNRDEIYVVPATFPLKRGDLALFLRENGIYVIHRIFKVVKVKNSTQYFMLGDNQTEIEGPIEESQIHGIAISLKRKGKIIDCKRNGFYKVYSALWLILRPFRPFFQRIASLLRKAKSAKNH